MRRFAAFTAAAFLLISVLLSSFSAIPAAADDEQTNFWPSGPEISGDGGIVIEATTGSILYAKNIYDTFFPASTTKILTTLVALENSDLNEIVTVSFAADNYVSKTSSRMGLVEGEQITMEQALYGIMLESANEGTYAVGEHVGGSIARFIKMMNRRAESLGCVNSHYMNSHGLHDVDHYSCCYDEALIAKAAFENEDFMRITGTATYAMPATNKNEPKILTNHHWFLNKTMKYDYCIGGKTGATTQAGYALVTYAKKDGMNLISVVMHAPTWEAVYKDTKTLLDYAFDNFKTYRMTDLAQKSTEFPSMFDEISMFEGDRPEVLTMGDGGIVVLPDAVSVEDTTCSIIFDPEAEVGHGDNKIGMITYNYGDRIVGAADIMYYNEADSMTDSRFNAEWPSYMIPFDVAFEGIDLDALRSAENVDLRTQSIAEILNLKGNAPILYGIGAGLFVLIVGLIVILLRRR